MTGTEHTPGEGHPYDRLPDAVTELFGEGATAEHAYDLLTVDVPAASWIAALETARDVLGCTYFDWLSAVDEPGTGFRVCAHVASLGGPDGAIRRLLVRTTVPHDAAELPTAIELYAGAAWHERETHEMFGIGFEGHPNLVPLLLPEGFEGYPLRKDFVLAARVAKAWPGAKEPGESEHGGPKRRTMLPPGVPDPNEWGPLKGQLPPAPSRPARGARAGGAGAAGAGGPAGGAGSAAGAGGPAGAARARGAAGAAGERPARRSRSVTEGSAGQRAAGAGAAADVEGAGAGAEAPAPRRSRSASQGPASRRPEPAPGTAPDTTDAAGSSDPAPASSSSSAPAPARESGTPARPAPRSADAPWHHARPTFDPDAESEPAPGPEADAPGPEAAAAEPDRLPAPESAPDSDPEPDPNSAPNPDPNSDPDRPAGGDTA